jgi:hypothetical protein
MSDNNKFEFGFSNQTDNALQLKSVIVTPVNSRVQLSQCKIHVIQCLPRKLFPVPTAKARSGKNRDKP